MAEADNSAHEVLPAGSLKRKAEDDPVRPEPKRIKALDKNVVNKIAAGEIIVAPVNALKELIENAVDAGATSLEIAVKDGGLKLLQITDNGHGIHKDDLPILCERFTTSKLKAFEDLTSIATYGFRGEALASISHIAHLTITTRPEESSCAWRATYADGKLVPAKPGQLADPKPTAGRKGTQITVEDLFYNVPSRQRAFRSPSEEYAKILDVVGRYAVHCEGVAFSCKKHGESIVSISTPANASTLDNIRLVHGSSVANELFPFEVESTKWGFKAKGLASNANYHVKRTSILLFINNRSVESSAVKKTIEQVYMEFLPKGGHPFVYLSLAIDPERVDVNVHPTKREVNFLNEDEIIETVCGQISEHLTEIDTSRTFMTQSLLPGSLREAVQVIPEGASRHTDLPQLGNGPVRVNENNMVRTDPNLRKITSMFRPAVEERAQNSSAAGGPQYTESNKARTECRLTSIKHLRAEVREDMHAGLTETFMAHSYIGVVDSFRRLCAMQSGVKLFLVDYGTISTEFFYQLGLAEFGNFGSIEFEQAMDLRTLINLAVEQERSEGGQDQDIEWESVPGLVTRQLTERREMLKEYFKFDISEDGQLCAMPLLLKGYTPFFAKLPRFLMRLGPCVDWNDEKGCFRTFLRELASFHTPVQLPPVPPPNVKAGGEPDSQGRATSGTSSDNQLPSLDTESMQQDPKPAPDDSENPDSAKGNHGENPEIARLRSELEFDLEHVLSPALKSRLVATKSMLTSVVEVANLKGLYKVFERC